MEWLVGAALLPLLLCGLMCVGGVALAMLGFRRRDAAGRKACCDHDEMGDRIPEGSSRSA